jgi:hypothetical protein
MNLYHRSHTGLDGLRRVVAAEWLAAPTPDHGQLNRQLANVRDSGAEFSRTRPRTRNKLMSLPSHPWLFTFA